MKEKRKVICYLITQITFKNIPGYIFICREKSLEAFTEPLTVVASGKGKSLIEMGYKRS